MNTPMNEYINEKLNGTAATSTLAKRIAFLNDLASMSSGSTDFAFLNNTKLTMARIRRSDNIDTQWNSLMHVVMAIKADPSNITDDAKAFYDKQIVELKARRLAKRDNNVRSEKQITTLDTELDQRQNELIKKIVELFKRYGFSHKGPTNAQLNKIDKFGFAKSLQDLMIPAVYLLQPALRSDWGSMHLTGRISNLSTDRNYLYVKGLTMTIIMNTYKNAKVLGQVRINVRPRLVELMTIWLRVLKNLLGGSPLHPLYYNITKTNIDYVENDEALRRQIPRISKRIFGVALSINDYRHLWEINIQTDPAYAKLSDDARKEIHKELLHGLHIAQLYNVH